MTSKHKVWPGRSCNNTVYGRTHLCGLFLLLQYPLIRSQFSAPSENNWFVLSLVTRLLSRRTLWMCRGLTGLRSLQFALMSVSAKHPLSNPASRCAPSLFVCNQLQPEREGKQTYISLGESHAPMLRLPMRPWNENQLMSAGCQISSSSASAAQHNHDGLWRQAIMMMLSEYIVHVRADRFCVPCDVPEIIYDVSWKKKYIMYCIYIYQHHVAEMVSVLTRFKVYITIGVVYMVFFFFYLYKRHK